MSRTKKDIEEIVREEMPEFAEECQSATTEALEARLSKCAKEREEIQDAKEMDEEYAEARAKATHLGSPYRDGMKYNRIRSLYIIRLIKERGTK